MFSSKFIPLVISLTVLSAPAVNINQNTFQLDLRLCVQPAFAESSSSKEATSGNKSATLNPEVSKAISQKLLEKYSTISITIQEDAKEVKYTGVPLRVILAEMVPDIKIDNMPDWKGLARRELILEVMADDGFPGLATATEVAINQAGDRYLLATHKDGKLIESGVRLVCKLDEHHVRWIRDAVSVRVVSILKTN
jgi:hypothetical protein